MLFSVMPAPWVTTTQRAARMRPAPDRVERNFTAAAPDRLYVADITYIPILARLPVSGRSADACTPRIVGSAMASHLRIELVLDALNMTLSQRRPDHVIHRSDQGRSYTRSRSDSAVNRPTFGSMGSVGDCFDKAMCESFFVTLECEFIDRNTFRTQADREVRGVRLHRRLLQPAATPFGDQLFVTDKLREENKDD